ncbi:MAG TPA: DNA polymerase III subunit alpha [Burkholderiales bacterium]|nr:DNA polymerase III subunit alpha [Burkholderiales bacterium]
MPQPAFVHLRLHSEYSIVDGIVRLDDAVRKAAEDRIPALALTDLNNLFGMVKFYQATRKSGIKPIVGCDVWLSDESDRDQLFRLLLLCQSHEGYLHLCRLLSRAYRGNQHRGRAEIRKHWFTENGTEGLIALSGAQLGDVGAAILQGNGKHAQALASEWAALFPQRFYIELQRAGAPHSENYVHQAMELATGLNLPVVATHPIQFLEAGDFKAHEARICIAEGYMLGDPRRPRLFTEQQYFKSQAEMAELFADIPEALTNSVEIAKRCNLKMELGTSRLPQFPTPNNLSLDQYLCERALAGLKQRLEAIFPDPVERAKQAPFYQKRLDFETHTVVQMGYSGYFLIVADFINWAKRNGVPVGPGRGSGAGSLVAYALGITDLDPLRYDLLFERFLNPERVSMPDFDVDFCQDGREKVIEYVKQRFGADSVSQIATFGTMAAKAAVRDVGRVLDLPYNFCDQVAKLIPVQPGKTITLQMARAMEPQLREREQKEEEVRELLALAGRVEGLTRNVGMHAGGVLIAPGKLTDYCPIYVAQGSDAVVSQFDKDDVEQIGLIKFDFLGLTTLTVLDWAVRYLRRLKPELKDFSLDNLPLDDKATYEIFASGNTTAVFQSESKSAKDLERRLKADCFEDLIALMALNRPGPLQSGMVDDFIKRKHGVERPEYFHPELEPVLKPTYGVIVYQEQVMQIAQVLGGYSLGAADLLRRAMGKKKPEEMAKHRSIFILGAVKHGVRTRQAEQLFGLMEKFAEYGFNKSHSAAYAMVAYQTAYLKAHYPAAFMAATLSAEMDDTDKVQIFCQDCIANGLELLPPDINLSGYRFEPVGERQIRYGLGAVKGTGEAAVAAIVHARETSGPFRDLFDFCRRIDKRLVNRRAIESLIRAGAFDSLNPRRASLLASVGIAMENAEQAQRSINQVSLFGEIEEAAAAQHVALVDVPEWPEPSRLQNEKMALGYYFSGHPFAGYRRSIEGFVKTRLSELTPQQQPVLLAGIIHHVRIQQTRRGRMAIVALDDGSGQVDCVVFSESFEAKRDLLKEDQLLIVEGKVGRDDFSGGLRVTAERIYDLTAARNQYARVMRISLNGEASAVRLRTLLGPYRKGACPVAIRFHNAQAACEVQLGEEWRVNLDDNLLRDLCEWLNPENVEVIY